ncbi:RNA-binding protein 44 [Myotis brandtii]|uniref:RNA-binding protein 44 n=1 Tax=Myotis brandtii TaxID=109478 RepID=S7MPE3_MYOBR|nr:RNA-binding protein 44 [Myotis brandtii]
MQATTVVKTAANKEYHNNGGNIQKDEPSNPKEGNLSSSSGCNEAKVTFSDDDWDFLALEQRANDKEISNIDKVDLLEPSFTASSDTNIESTRCQSREFEDSIDYVFLNETYSVLYSESKLKDESLTLSNSELGSEIQKREMFFDIVEHKLNKIIDLEKIKISDDDCKETAEDVQKYDTDEDSQQEYHSAEEQEYLSNHLTLDQTKTLNISNLEVVGLRNSGYEIKHAGNLEVNHIKLESSSISLDSIDDYGQEDSPHVSKYQNSVMLGEYHKPKHEKCKDQETSLMYHTVFDEIILRNSPSECQESQSKSGFFNLQQALKTNIYTGKIKSQVTESKDFCGNATVENKMLQHLENPSTLAQEKALETLLQPFKDCQTSCTSICDDSVISAYGHSHYKSLPSIPNSVLDYSVTPPRIGAKDNQAMKEDSSLKVTNGSATNKMCFHSVEGTHPKFATEAAKCTITVNQTVDVSTDFRACFTNSRATSTRPSVVSTSSNTEITMMNKKRPGEWQRGKQRSVGCNTDWSYSQDNEDTPVAVTKGLLGKSLSVDSLKPNGNFLNKVSLLSDNSHPKQGTSPKEDDLKNGDIDGYFSQLKLDDKDPKHYQETSEDWFDAKESLTGVDCSGIQENQIEHDKWDPNFTSGDALLLQSAGAVAMELGVKKKNCKQIESTKLLPDTPIRFIPPNTLNLRSFTKIMKRLAELHPDVSRYVFLLHRDHIIDALQEVRINHKGFLNGLSINTIVDMTSSVLKNSASS